MNHLASFLAALSLVGALVSCGLTPDQETPVKFVIGVSHANLTEPWRITMNSEIQEEAALSPGLKLIVADAGDSADRQVADVARLVASGIDLLIISPTDSQALTAAVSDAYRKVPVILLDRAVEGYAYTLYIGPDNRRIGRLMGSYVAQALGPRGGNVIEVQGRSGSPPVLDRSLGFREALAGTPQVKIVDTVVADWLRDRAQDALGLSLARHPGVDFVAAQNDAMALGAFRAAADQNLAGVRFAGIDGLPGPDGGIDLVARGVLAATFHCPTGGREALGYALDILNRAPGIPKKLFLRPRIITRSVLEAGTALPAPRPSSRPIVLGYAQTGRESHWREANTESIKAAAKASGIELLFRDADQKQSLQIAALREFIARKVDVIAFPPLVETGWDEVLAEAKAAGIPVIFSDRTARTQDESLVTTILGGDFAEEGRRAARWLAETLPRPGDRAGTIVEIRGTEGSTPAIERAQGFREVLADQPGYRILDSADGDFRKDGGRAVMAGFLRRWGTGIRVVFAHNDDMALGAIQAIEDAGLKPGTDIIIVSIDGVRAAFEAMAAGKLNCTVECSPLLGPQLMKAVKDYALGKELPVRIITEEGVFPQETAAAALGNRRY